MERFGRLAGFDAAYGPMIAGVDEAGRGPWAGPVVAAAVIINPAMISMLSEIDDSKKLTEKKREKLFNVVTSCSLAYAIAEASNAVIDSGDILSAAMDCMAQAVKKLSPAPLTVLVDGNRLPELGGINAKAVTGGDAKSLSIAAASVLAKVHRDRIMRNYDRIFPGYGFAEHKGYGTAAHMKALEKLGVTEIHRKSYKPVGKYLNKP